MSMGEVWSIVSSVVSVILAVLAIALAIYFYVQSKNSEQNVATSLAKIEAQADALQRINAKWMDRLTRYVTEERQASRDPAVPQLIQILAQIPNTLTATLTRNPENTSQDQLVNELYAAHIAIYFYTAQTNYWSQYYLPSAADFNQEDPFHSSVKRVVDLSCADFEYIASLLEKCDRSKLNQNRLVHLLNETQGTWRNHVKSTADVFVEREKAGGAG